MVLSYLYIVSTQASVDDQQVFTTVGTYMGNVVAIRRLQTTKIDINRKVLVEIKMVCVLINLHFSR